jgi:hypothetical protein
MLFYSIVFILLLILAITVKLSMQRRWDKAQLKNFTVNFAPPKPLRNPEQYEEGFLHWIALGLAEKRPLLLSEIHKAAEDPLLRAALYQMMYQCEALRWFPERWATVERMAESHMVSWLYFPTKMACRPDELALLAIEDVTYAHKPYRYYVYRFRVHAPHELAADGWMLGCVGPYFPYDGPLAVPSGTCSRFQKEGTVTTFQEAEWVFHNIYLHELGRQGQAGKTAGQARGDQN